MNERQKLLIAELDRAKDGLLGDYRKKRKLIRKTKMPIAVRDAARQIAKLQKFGLKWERAEEKRLRAIRNKVEQREMMLKHDILTSTDKDSAVVLRKIQRFARTGK